MDYEQSKATFLANLKAKSQAGRIPWQEDADSNSFSVLLSSKYRVRVNFVNNAKNFSLKVINIDDTTLFSFTESLAAPGELQEMYQLARRKALRVDEALTELLNDLDSQ